VRADVTQGQKRVEVMEPKGRLDMASAPAFRERVKQLVESGSDRLIVDLGEVSFVDSSGLGAVIGGLKVARQAGGDLRIARANEQVKLVLELTSLNRLLHPYVTLEQALEGF
jgi:anti-sigma B factor antagonist